MNSQIDEFERIMLDYLKGEISSEDMQKLTILLKGRMLVAKNIVK